MNAPHDGLVPGVEHGFVLAYPCPRCRRWARPAGGPCGCRICVLCGFHVPVGPLEQQVAAVRRYMPRVLSSGSPE